MGSFFVFVSFAHFVVAGEFPVENVHVEVLLRSLLGRALLAKVGLNTIKQMLSWTVDD